MKKIIFLFVFLLVGCEVNDTNYSFEEGYYSGTFIIVESDGQTLTGNVNFSFINDQYSVIPETRYLPPVGAGMYEIYLNVINITDTVPHTAEFDWTLILNGNFEFSYNDQVLTLKQNDIKHNRKRTISLTKQN